MFHENHSSKTQPHPIRFTDLLDLLLNTISWHWPHLPAAPVQACRLWKQVKTLPLFRHCLSSSFWEANSRLFKNETQYTQLIPPFVSSDHICFLWQYQYQHTFLLGHTITNAPESFRGNIGLKKDAEVHLLFSMRCSGKRGKCNPISQTRLKFAVEMEKESESKRKLSISLTERLTLPDPPSSHLYTQVYTMTYLCHPSVSIQAANVPAI